MPTPDRYAVIGNPIAHSKSPDIHALFAAQTKQNMQYQRLLAPLDKFESTIRQFIAEGGKGLNVTVPFKLDALALATSLTPRAQAAGAVNTLKFEKNTILGDNTDGKGLMTDIIQNTGYQITGAKVLLLGAGGAARGVIQPLLEQCPAKLVMANRSLNKAKELADFFAAAGHIEVSAFSELNEEFDIIINATSAGLSDDMPPIPSKVFRKSALALDMVYGDQLTPFLHFAAKNGACIRDGFGMLVEQAAESFFVWRGVRPDTRSVFSVLRPSSS
ncbi:MAG: shikimate dehydrogenase [Betaproteobacteria bacterium]|nr:shikimate dehydrogenase [Betaproteobacteria bacterium]